MEAVKRETIGMREAGRHAVQSAGHHRLEHDRGLRVSAAGPAGPIAAGAGRHARGLIAVANQQPELSDVFSTFSTDNPQIYLRIDREKAQTLGFCRATSSRRCRRRSAAIT